MTTREGSLATGARSGARAPVLVTGGTGFVGRHLVRRLVDEGHPVRALVRSGPGDLAGATVVAGDIGDEAVLRQALEGCDRVLHLAAATARNARHPGDYRRVNVEATDRLFGVAAGAGVSRFVHVSTTGVLGPTQGPPATEDAPPRPDTAYRRTKLEGERRAVAAARERGLHTVVVRPMSVYGPGARNWARLFEDVLTGRVLVVGPGTHRLHLTYVDDLVDGLLLAARADVAPGEIFHVGSREILTLNEVLEEIAAGLETELLVRRLPRQPAAAAFGALRRVSRWTGVDFPVLHRWEFHGRDRAYSVEKARRRMGYLSRVSLAEGAARTAAWLRDEGLLADPGETGGGRVEIGRA